MDLNDINENNGMEKLKKTAGKWILHLNRNQSVYSAAEKYQKLADMSVCEYFIKFKDFVTNLRDNIKLPEPMLTYSALKNTYLSQETKRLKRSEQVEF